MNDHDIEALAFVESKVNELKTLMTDHFVFIVRDGLNTIRLGITMDLDAISQSIDKIKPADGRYTLSQIIALRRILKDHGNRMNVVVNKVEQRLDVVAHYIETYIAQGVSPLELDVSGKDIIKNVQPISILVVDMVGEMCKVHPLAYGILDGFRERQESVMKSFFQRVDTHNRITASKIAQVADLVNSQETFLMSGDGIERREIMLGRLSQFYTSLRVFLS